MDKFISNGICLEYEVTGEGLPLVFLHGMGGSIQQIYATYQPLPGVKLITLNQQGHGGSGADWETLDFDRLGDDVAALLDHLGIERAYFAGISMGAAVSLNVAVRYPKRAEKLLLIRNAWTDRPMEEKVQIAYRDMGQSLKNGGVEAFFQTKGWEIVKEPSLYTRNAFLNPFQNPVEIQNWKKYLILPSKTPISSKEELQKLSIPVTILANKNDLCHPFSYGEYLQKYIPDSKLTQIPDKDTDSNLHRQMINQAVREIMAGCGH